MRSGLLIAMGVSLVIVLGVTCIGGGLMAKKKKVDLKVGDEAPLFSVPNQKGETFNRTSKTIEVTNTDGHTITIRFLSNTSLKEKKKGFWSCCKCLWCK